MDQTTLEQSKSILENIYDFIADNIFVVVLVIAGAIIAQMLINKFIGRLVERSVAKHRFPTKRDSQAREKTLKAILSAASTIFIWVTAIFVILGQFDINLGPLIASAGIVGIAVGFGAQSLVKDVVTGIFILYENQFRIGDVVELNQEVSGVVEDFTMRITVLRDLDGMKHYIPNGEITIVTNMTMEFSGVNLDIGVGYDTDLEKLEKVINKVGDSLANDEDWKEKIIESPQFLRVDEFADSAIVVKITGKTHAMEQWAVTGELRKRLKIAFDKNGIEIPFPQRVLHQAPNSK
jgi:small conductance mechanosensitive channel